MKTFISVLFVIAGLAAAVYIGGYLCLITGIVEFIRGVTAHPISAHDIGWGIGRFLVTSIVVWLCIGAGGVIAALVRSE